MLGKSDAPNGGKWTRNPRSTVMLAPDDNDAYWGIAYFDYVGNNRSLFRCPSAKIVDEWRETGLTFPSDFWLDSSYGLNSLWSLHSTPASLSPGKSLPLSHWPLRFWFRTLRNKKMDGASDTIAIFPGKSEILTQWRYELAPLYGGYAFEYEWFRHRKNVTHFG